MVSPPKFRRRRLVLPGLRPNPPPGRKPQPSLLLLLSILLQFQTTGALEYLVCPADRRVGAPRRIADNWSNSPNGGLLNAAYKNSAISLTVEPDATSLRLAANGSGAYGTYWTTKIEATQDQMVISDRNLKFDDANRQCGSGLSLVQTALRTGAARWTNAIHGVHGNVGQVDGSVHQTTITQLRAYIL